MTYQISDWAKYSDLLQQLASMQLDWSTWANLTSSIVMVDPGLWGAVPENSMYGHGLAELLGEIYQVQPTDVDLDDASQLKATDQHVLSMLWHIVKSQPATQLAGYESWDGYFVCQEPDGSFTCATSRDAENWDPVGEADEADDEVDDEAGGWGTTDVRDEQVATGSPDASEVEATIFGTTEEAQDGAGLVTDLVQETLDRAVSALPGEVLEALSPQDLENLAVEANKAVAAGE